MWCKIFSRKNGAEKVNKDLKIDIITMYIKSNLKVKNSLGIKVEVVGGELEVDLNFNKLKVVKLSDLNEGISESLFKEFLKCL